jgi:LPS sulfotransferase NodH
MMRPPLTFVICATPRTGSTLLCALLAATGVAGRPESIYWAEDRADWAEEWGVSCDFSRLLKKCRSDSAAYQNPENPSRNGI